MSTDHMIAVILSFSIYGLLVLSFYGWGKLISGWIVGHTTSVDFPISYCIWMGWAATTAVLQLVQFVLPLRAYSVLPIYAAGILMTLYLVKKRPHRISKRAVLTLIGVGILSLPLLYWIISHAMLVPDHIDSGLYHFQLLKWINSYPTIKGLGNLHSRLAFNQSFFFYTAALNFSPYFSHGPAIANSFLFILSIATCAEKLYRVYNYKHNSAHPFEFLPALFSLPVIIYLVINPKIPNGLAAPTPDFSASLLQIMILIILSEVIARWNQVNLDQQHKIALLGMLSITAITNKLSSAVLTFVIVIYIYLYCRKHALNKLGIILLLIGLVIGMVWIGRNLLLSGAPLYPSIAYRLPAKWAMPESKILQELNFIKGWARRTPVGDGSQVVIIGGNNWLPAWITGMLKYTTEFVYPLIITGIVILTTLSVTLITKSRHVSPMEWSTMIPIALSLAYWFVTAPDIRFAHAMIFLLANTVCILFLTQFSRTLERRHWFALVGIVFIICNLSIGFTTYTNRSDLLLVSSSGWHDLPEEPWAHKNTTSGLQVTVPDDLLCWDAPLPCTPPERFEASLSLITPDNMGDGFMITPASE